MADAVTHQDKLLHIWSSRRERDIAVRVYYTVEDDDCRIFRIEQVEELE